MSNGSIINGLAHFEGNPTGSGTSRIDVDAGTIVVDTETPAIYLKTSNLGNNSGYQKVSIGQTVQNVVTDWGVVLNQPMAAVQNRINIQAALDAHAGPVYLPYGICYISDYLQVNYDNQRFFGAGLEQSILQLPSGKRAIQTAHRVLDLSDMSILGDSNNYGSEVGIMIGVDGNTYTSNAITLRNLKVSFFNIGIYNGKADASNAFSCIFNENDYNFVSDGNQSDFGMFGCTLNDSNYESVTVLAGGGVGLYGCLVAGCAFTSGNVVVVDQGRFLSDGTYYEGVNNNAENGVYVLGRNNAEITFVESYFNSAGAPNQRMLQLTDGTSGFASIHGGGYSGTPLLGAHVWSNGRAKAHGTQLVGAYFGDVTNGLHLLGDYEVRKFGDSLPSITAQNRGEKVLMLGVDAGAVKYDEIYTCIKTAAGTYGFVNNQANAYNITSDPHRAGVMWNNSALPAFSVG